MKRRNFIFDIFSVGLVSFITPRVKAKNFKINNDDRIAQMVLTPVIKIDLKETDEIADTMRGASGFGSTGK